MRDTQPALFGQAVALERLINERRLLLGKDQVWFSSRLKPLDQATTEYIQGTLFEEDSLCESGYCFV